MIPLVTAVIRRVEPKSSRSAPIPTWQVAVALVAVVAGMILYLAFIGILGIAIGGPGLP